MTTIVIPSWPQYNDYRDLKPPKDEAELTQLCQRILDEHAGAVDQLHGDVRKMLAVGTVHGRKWACNQVRQFLATTGREQLLERYFERLRLQQQSAKELPFYDYLPIEVKQALEIEVERDMSHDLRIQVRDALAKAQEWERDAEQSGGPDARRHGPSRERRQRRAERSQRDRERTRSTRGDVVRR